MTQTIEQIENTKMASKNQTTSHDKQHSFSAIQRQPFKKVCNPIEETMYFASGIHNTKIKTVPAHPKNIFR